MHAIQIRRTGGPDVLEYANVPEPEPGPGQVRIKLAAIGVNFIDIYYRIGLYPATLPLIPGEEGAGVVEKLGPGVVSLAVGDRVAYTGVGASYSELVVAQAERLVKLPASISFVQGAAAMLQGMTAHYLSTATYPLKPDDVALVHAGAGGVGLLLTQMAKIRGATVISTVSTEQKAELSRKAGADHVIIYTKQNFLDEVTRITGNRGVSVVYDSVGRDTFEHSLNCLRPRGYLVLYGQSSGKVPPVDPQILNSGGSLFLTRPTLRDYIAGTDSLRMRAGEVFGWIESGRLSLRTEHNYPLSQAFVAQSELEGRRTTGKIVLIPGE